MDCKSNELRRIYQENDTTKKSLGVEIDNLKKVNEELRKRMKQLEKYQQEELESFKIKMANLIDADLKGLNSYYLNQIDALTGTNYELQKINESVKEKLYKSIQDND